MTEQPVPKATKSFISELEWIDLVLIHPNVEKTNQPSCLRNCSIKFDNIELRNIFEKKLNDEQFIVKETNDKSYKILRCDFNRLCEEAENTNLEMPSLVQIEPTEEPSNLCLKFLYNTFVPDKYTSYPISLKFMVKSLHLFKNHDDRENFFPPSVRTLLVDHILTNINIKADDLVEYYHDYSGDNMKGTELSEKDEKRHKISINEDDKHDKEKRMLKTYGLSEKDKVNFLFMEKVGLYTDKMILHEISVDSRFYELNRDGTSLSLCPGDLEKDPRKDLHDKWTGFFQLQPMTEIRNYFGEKIAFYFAWVGILVATLWLPLILGLVIFIYGIHKSASNETDSSRVFTEACDNDVTPFYALFICVWGTFFLKLWKRQTATLASQWAVDEFSATETDRPEFYGTLRKDSITKKQVLYYPMLNQLQHFMVSGLTVVFMLCVVLASVIGVIVYRVFVSIDYCSSNTAEACVLVTTIASSLLNTLSILVLSKLYNLLARQLTIWENHRTQTSFDNALIIKMFAFEFVNNYSSCFYIAFFRGRFGEEGILGLGGNYPDSCEPDGNCMSELTFQILILTICKPLPKFFTDIVLLWIRLLWIKRPQWCRNGKVEERNKTPEEFIYIKHVKIESLKPSLDNFTMEEYTEKIIQYGFLMLFAASLPIAPLIVIITNLIDMRIDAYRLLWLYRRPVAKRAQDIGIWYTILQFVNICGVISNGCLISLTSSWGRQYTDYTRLWIVVGFEHIVFALQFIIAYLIPDVPSHVKLRSKKIKYLLSDGLKYDENLLKQQKILELTNQQQLVNNKEMKDTSQIVDEESVGRHKDVYKDKKPQGQVFTELPVSV